jgi:hypothetical protein
VVSVVLLQLCLLVCLQQYSRVTSLLTPLYMHICNCLLHIAWPVVAQLASYLSLNPGCVLCDRQTSYARDQSMCDVNLATADGARAKRSRHDALQHVHISVAVGGRSVHHAACRQHRTSPAVPARGPNDSPVYAGCTMGGGCHQLQQHAGGYMVQANSTLCHGEMSWVK